MDEGALLSIYDPKVGEKQIKNDLTTSDAEVDCDSSKVRFVYSKSLDNAIDGSHAILILTEWKEFKEIKWDHFFRKMKRPSWVFDTRSVVDVCTLEKLGFNVWQIGNCSQTNP